MTLRVQVPSSYPEERAYIVAVMLREFLGLDYRLQRAPQGPVRITSDDGRELVLADQLFETPAEGWLTEAAMPRQPLDTWNASECLPELPSTCPQVPVIYGAVLPNGDYWHADERSIQLGLDIFGSAFYMLSRCEEIVKRDVDAHSRFPATASLAHQEGFLDRPVVNEYLEVLWACMKRLWPRLRRKRREYRPLISHDVDQPLSVANKSWLTVLRNAGGDLLYRKDFQLVLQRLLARLVSYQEDFTADPCNTFDFLMETSERRGLQVAFYFITDHSGGGVDGDYSIDMPWIRGLMRRIHARGHEIGLHPSYNTFQDAAQTNREFAKLLQVAEAEGVKQNRWGGRQHYLRWEAPTTWQIWEEAGLSYDSTLTFADRPGFRCGVCYDYPVFNLRTRRQLKLRERPLVVMDGTLFTGNYMNLSPSAGQEKIYSLAKTCEDFNGQFTLLWHNNELLARWQKQMYREVVEQLV